MKCAFNPCGEVNHLSIKLTHGARGEQEDFFCGYAHLLAFLVMHLQSSAQAAISQALMASQSRDGRKALLSYLVEKIL